LKATPKPSERPVDESTLIQTYRECVHLLYEYASHRCGGDRGLAEDVTQEAWLRAVQAWKKGGLPDQPLAWLRTVARNLIINYYQRRRPISLEGLPAGWDEAPQEGGFALETPDAAALVNWGLSRLRRPQAQLLEAFHLEGRKVSEIAIQTGLSERAVEGRLRRAREKLRRTLESTVRRNGGTT
jgi:RNA polymerase sigma-70 factor (ECF subfamily)